MGGEQEAERFEASGARIASLSLGELLAASDVWLAGEAKGAFAQGTFRKGDVDAEGRAREPPVGGLLLRLTSSEAGFLVEGVTLFHFVTMESPDVNAVTYADLLRRALVPRLWSRPEGRTGGVSCHGVYASSGEACRANVDAAGLTSTCGRHKAQDMLTALARALCTYPEFDPTGIVFCRRVGAPPEHTGVAICPICLRGRGMEDCVSECIAMGAASGGSSAFSHRPDWLSDPSADRFDRPGSQFCLACAAEFPLSCQLVAFRSLSTDAHSDGAEMADDLRVPALSLWAFCPSVGLVAPSRVASLGAFARSSGIGVTAAFSSGGAPDTPGTAAAGAVRAALAKNKPGTNSAFRTQLGAEVAFGRGLGGHYESPGAQDGGWRAEVEEPPAVQKYGRVPGDPEPADISKENQLFAALRSGASRDQIMPLLDRWAMERAARNGSLLPVVEAGVAAVPMAPASGAVTGADLEAMRVSFEDQLLELKVALSSGGGGRMPTAPLVLVYPMEPDRDGFGVTDPAHEQSLDTAGSEDYLGAIYDPSAYGTRRLRHAQTRRIDIPRHSEGRPGGDAVSGHEDFVLLGTVRLTGKPKANGLPSRGDFLRFEQSRVTDLSDIVRRGEGIYSKSSAYRAWAVFEVKVMLVRYQYLAAVEHYLTDVRTPPTSWGVIYRYLCVLVLALWRHKPIGHLGVDRDLGELALAADLDQLRVQQGAPALLTLASQSINLAWLQQAQRESDEAQFGKPKSGEPAGGGASGGDGKPEPRKCRVCGKQSCGLYVEPAWACTADIVMPCYKCKLKHVVGGPRGWKCGGAKAAINTLTPAELRVAFRTTWTKFMAGGTSVSAAQVDAVRVAAG
jgi:hypothetical protein